MSTRSLKALLCPKCKYLSLNGWKEIRAEINKYFIKVDQLTGTETPRVDCIDSDLQSSIHFCPDSDWKNWFTTENYPVEDFLVVTVWENKQLKEVKPLGNYYQKHPLPRIGEIKYDFKEFEDYLNQ